MTRHEVPLSDDADDGNDDRSLRRWSFRGAWLARWIAEAPSRWLGRSSSVAQDLAGGADGISYLRHLARGNRIRRTADFENLDGQAPPVLLIHGFLGTRGSMYMLERRLVDDGFVVVSFNIGTLNTRDIRRSAFMIHRKIERILAQTPWQKIDIIGHSMGGLIGLYFIKKLGGHHRVRRLVMMGTPVRGTWVALAGIATLGLWSTSSWQLLPRSRFLDELSQGPLPPDVEVHTIAAARDWVCPLPSTRLPGAGAVTVPLGHSSLVVSEEVYKRLINILRPARDRAGAVDDADARQDAGEAQAGGIGVGVKVDSEPTVEVSAPIVADTPSTGAEADAEAPSSSQEGPTPLSGAARSARGR